MKTKPAVLRPARVLPDVDVLDVLARARLLAWHLQADPVKKSELDPAAVQVVTDDRLGAAAFVWGRLVLKTLGATPTMAELDAAIEAALRGVEELAAGGVATPDNGSRAREKYSRVREGGAGR